MLAQEPSPLTPLAPAECICGQPEFCSCPATERALRLALWHRPEVQFFSPEQREWCLSQIDAVEGHTRKAFDGVSDCEIARGVLDAWTDYCRDKGLL